MKLRSACLLFVVWVVSCAALAGQGDESSVPRVSLQEFKRDLVSNAVVVLDVRSHDNYLQGHIPGAVSAPLDALAARVEEFKKLGKPIVTYCS